MRYSLTSLACALLILTATTTAQPGPTSRPAIKVGKDTTWISKPLKPDGTPDYIAALREQFGKGVTKDNNAFVPLLEALGPELLPKVGRQKTLKMLGVKLPAAGVYLRRPEKSSPIKAQFGSALKRPWTAKEHPELAKWLKANAGPLAKLVAASKRSRFYAPPVVAKEGPIALTLLLPSYGDVRHAAQLLIVRATLAVGEGRMDDAIADLAATYRLGALIGHDYRLIGRLVSIRIASRATTRMGELAASETLTAREARLLIDVLRARKLPSAAPGLHSERYDLLDAIIWLARKPSGARYARLIRDMNVGLRGAGEAPIPAQSPLDPLFERADYNVALRRMNAMYDEMIKIEQLPTHAQRVKAAKSFEATLMARLKGAPTRPSLRADRAAVSDWVANRLVCVPTPFIARVVPLMDVAGARRSMTAVALALAAHKADKGRYPARLGALAPAYLKRVPVDFCSGKPFVYKLRAQGFVLYSVGMNMRDDGGRAKGEGDDCDDFVIKTR